MAGGVWGGNRPSVINRKRKRRGLQMQGGHEKRALNSGKKSARENLSWREKVRRGCRGRWGVEEGGGRGGRKIDGKRGGHS